MNKPYYIKLIFRYTSSSLLEKFLIIFYIKLECVKFDIYFSCFSWLYLLSHFDFFLNLLKNNNSLSIVNKLEKVNWIKM